MSKFTTLSDAELDAVCGGLLNAGAGGNGGSAQNGATIIGGDYNGFGGNASGGFGNNNGGILSIAKGGNGGKGGSVFLFI